MSTCPAGCARIVVAFQLDQRPHPKGRPRFGQGRTYTDAKTATYETAIRNACRTQMQQAPIEGPVRLMCLFEQTDGRAADVDNLVKAVSDGIEGVAFLNDKQVTEIHARRVLRAATDRVSVAVLEVVA